jgi:transposase
MVLGQEPETIMAVAVTPVILGIDVSKDWLDVCQQGLDQVERINNARTTIEALLKRHPNAAIAVEATNTYHELLVDRALQRGMAVYVINGYQLKHYANSLGQRMRTDQGDARLLARFLEREISDLKPYQPRNPRETQVRRLLGRRAMLVKLQTQLRQSFEAVTGFTRSVNSVLARTKGLIVLIDKRLNALTRELGWQADLARLRSLPGVGPLTALALLEAYHSGQFNHRDPFIAFLGMDLRSKDSGVHTGKRRLTKQGNPETRRLLFNAAMAAISSGRYFRPDYLAFQNRGFSKIQALVAISRKIAKLAFAMLKQQTTFDPNYRQRACPAA